MAIRLTKRSMQTLLTASSAAGALMIASVALAETQPPPQIASETPDARAARTVAKMTADEKLSLVRGWFGASIKGAPPPLGAPAPAAALQSAGYVPGVPRLGIPALQETDASLGVANSAWLRPGDQATPLPSALAVAASWNPTVAFNGGAMIGAEAHAKGFNVLLAGGANLAREPRNGRTFEYPGEDPLLSGVMAGEMIRGVQSQHVISTAKHYAANDQETGRMLLNVVMDEKAMRESDLLAFEIALERGKPGAVMCAYNKFAGDYACENAFLLTTVLKHDWRYPGWVMSDWGAAHSTVKAALAGLDQESAHTFDAADFYGPPLKAALASGAAPEARLDDMAHRILRSMFEVGLIEHPAKPGGAIDVAAHANVAAQAEEEGIVLLKNADDLLPLAASAKTIAVIGGHADAGVLSGGGSTQVLAYGGSGREIPVTSGPLAGLMKMIYHPFSPLAAIKAAAPGAAVTFSGGEDVAAAVEAAKHAEVAVVFATQWRAEGQDASLTLDGQQDALIEAVATANPHTIVVLETGGAVLTPWASKVGAIVEAWYPGAEGGRSIARVLFGQVNPSGKLPITFPASLDQLPNPKLPGSDHTYALMYPKGPPFDVHYPEGAAVGYRWYQERGLAPLYPFGFGLSYTHFAYGALKTNGGKNLTVTFTVTNTGRRTGAEVAEVYVQPPGGAYRRLVGFTKVTLKPNETRRVSITAERRLLAGFDTHANHWTIKPGAYAVAVGGSSDQPQLTGQVVLTRSVINP